MPKLDYLICFIATLIALIMSRVYYPVAHVMFFTILGYVIGRTLGDIIFPPDDKPGKDHSRAKKDPKPHRRH